MDGLSRPYTIKNYTQPLHRDIILGDRIGKDTDATLANYSGF